MARPDPSPALLSPFCTMQMVWLLRLTGWLLAWVGLGLCINPLQMPVSWVQWVGEVVLRRDGLLRPLLRRRRHEPLHLLHHRHLHRVALLGRSSPPRSSLPPLPSWATVRLRFIPSWSPHLPLHGTSLPFVLTVSCIDPIILILILILINILINIVIFIIILISIFFFFFFFTIVVIIISISFNNPSDGAAPADCIGQIGCAVHTSPLLPSPAAVCLKQCRRSELHGQPDSPRLSPWQPLPAGPFLSPSQSYSRVQQPHQAYNNPPGEAQQQQYPGYPV